MRRLLILSSALLALGVLHAAAVSTAQTVVAGNITSGPNSDASVVAAVPNATGVSIIERQGGWYHVRLASGQDGWLPMTSIRYNSGTTGTAQSTDWSSLFQSGRSGAAGSTATTGVRGLNTGDIANAVPNPKAVAELDQWQAKPGQAKNFAAALPLTADPKIAWLPKANP
ncbi:MAG TPA: SH3 domain-containing protein [Gammaproteobacteria bacterium]|jgi:hypothetical protein|nr:SH3 domain-containing protein [Gammaproteobacteria bacterium]